ncbi:hypothetical protein [Mycobacterium triplex]|uniref:hypothetical protein n=1 Tax=Mycobacterium triplex TaxID=47839 RepID=UPI0018DCD24A|nr:hypothetical protein [Mycobacterium triplex]
MQCGDDTEGVELAQGIVTKGMHGIQLTLPIAVEMRTICNSKTVAAAAMVRPRCESGM